ncbi:MAG: hypothetical protein R3E32_24455 [Chitinophagales bacterium]
MFINYKIILVITALSLLYLSNRGIKDNNNILNEKEFLDYHLALIDTMTVLTDVNLESYKMDWKNDFPCEYMQNQEWLKRIRNHLEKYDYIGMFNIQFNPPMLCGQSIIFDEYKFTKSAGDFQKNLFYYTINQNLKLEIYIAGFDKDKPLLESFQGEIRISGVKQNSGYMYAGKYDFNATILIPKDFTEWKEKIQSKSIKEILEGTVKL